MGNDERDSLYYCFFMDRSEAFNHASRVVRRSGTSFYWAMRLLPRERRESIYSVYAFCREVDDIADGNALPSDKYRKLDEWRYEIESVFSAVPRTTIGKALTLTIERFRLKKIFFHDVLDGMVTDSGPVVRMTDAEAFDRYLNQVACSVGRLSNPIFGITGQNAENLARSLGRALQLTNILRDVYCDARRDRLYVPHDLILRHKIPITTPMEIISHPGFSEIFNALIAEARKHFVEATETILACDPNLIMPPKLMLEIYSRILDKVESGYQTTGQRKKSLSRLELGTTVLKYAIFKKW
jgi:squalene synthase HpnD